MIIFSVLIEALCISARRVYEASAHTSFTAVDKTAAHNHIFEEIAHLLTVTIIVPALTQYTRPFSVVEVRAPIKIYLTAADAFSRIPPPHHLRDGYNPSFGNCMSQHSTKFYSLYKASKLSYCLACSRKIDVTVRRRVLLR